MASGIHNIVGTVEPTPIAQNGDAAIVHKLEVHANGKADAVATSANGTAFRLGDFSIDDCRPMKVVVIGAGFTGIIAGIR